eukprot:symbB.v1.2.017378.t1/scaffold1349.1/size123878/5
MVSLAYSLWKDGQRSEAEELYRRGLLIAESTLGPKHPTTLHCLNNLAVIAKETGRTGELGRLLGRRPGQSGAQPLNGCRTVMRNTWAQIFVRACLLNEFQQAGRCSMAPAWRCYASCGCFLWQLSALREPRHQLYSGTRKSASNRKSSLVKADLLHCSQHLGIGPDGRPTQKCCEILEPCQLYELFACRDAHFQRSQNLLLLLGRRCERLVDRMSPIWKICLAAFLASFVWASHESLESCGELCGDDSELLQIASNIDSNGIIPKWFEEIAKILYNSKGFPFIQPWLESLELGYRVDLTPMQRQPPYDHAFARDIWLYSTAAQCPIKELKNWPADFTNPRCKTFAPGQGKVKPFADTTRPSIQALEWVGRLLLIGKTKWFQKSVEQLKDWTVGNHRGYVATDDNADLVESIQANPDYDVIFTGHSLGGAAITLAAADYLHRIRPALAAGKASKMAGASRFSFNEVPELPECQGCDDLPKQKPLPSGVHPTGLVKLYTYGSPRAGSPGAANMLHASLNASYRVTRNGDPVPLLMFCQRQGSDRQACKPAEQNAYHLAQEVYYPFDNETHFMCNGLGEDPFCADERSVETSYSLKEFGDGFGKIHTAYFGMGPEEWCCGDTSV